MAAARAPSRAGRIVGWLALLGLGLAAVTLRVWADRTWSLTFNSDEAIFGLMARHILDGERPLYFWGQNYLGGAEAYLSAPFVAGMGMTVAALRTAGICLFAGVLALQSWLVWRHAGQLAAAVALLLVAAPADTLIFATANLVSSFGTMGLLGLGGLGLLVARGERWAAARLFVVGVLLGLTVWVKAIGVVYFAGPALVCLLRAPEWPALRARLGWPGWLWLTGAATAAGLGVLALFADGCADPLWRSLAADVAQALLTLGVAAVAGGLLLVSRRRRALAARGGAAALGAAVGYGPAIAAWLGGQRPASGALPSCPTGIPGRLSLLVNGIVPYLAGERRGSASILDGRAHTVAVVGLLLGLLALALWQRRAAIGALLAGRPGPDESFVLGLALTIAADVAVVAASATTLDASAARYLVPGWHALTIVAAAGAARAGRWVAVPTIALIGLVIGAPSVASVAAAPSAGQWSPEWTRGAEAWLVARGATTGFADYWTAYVLDYVSAERLRLSVFSGINRQPAYDAAQAGQPLLGYVFEVGEAPAGIETLGPAAGELRRRNAAPGYLLPAVLDRMPRQTIVDRARFGPWEAVVAAEGGRVDPAYVTAQARPAALDAGGQVALVGYMVAREGDARAITLRLFWRAQRRPDFDYSAAVHLVDAGGRLVAQQDHAPGEAAGNPPSRWAPGDVVVDPHQLRLPPDAPAGQYRLRVGLYDWRDGRPLPIGGPGQPPGPVAVLDDPVTDGD